MSTHVQISVVFSIDTFSRSVHAVVSGSGLILKNAAAHECTKPALPCTPFTHLTFPLAQA